MAVAVPKALVDDLVERGAGDKAHVRNMLRHLAEAAADAVAAGEDFTVPGIAKISFAYRKPQKKGARWKKGETVVGFGGIESVKEEDSPAVKAQIKLRAAVTGEVGRLKPKNDSESQAAFIKSKAGKNIIKRKG